MKTTINERFAEFVKVKGMNTSSFAKSIDKSYTSVESILKGKTKPSFELLESVFERYPNLSRDWLLMGESDMFRKEEQVEVAHDGYLHEHLQSLESNFNRLAAQLESKDQQIASLQESQKSLQESQRSLQDMLKMVLGKFKGANKRPLRQYIGVQRFVVAYPR